MKKLTYISLLILLISACQKVIDLDIADAEPRLVIEANYDAVKEEVLVKISKTVNVFSSNEYPEISGAEIEITDKNGVSTPLIDQGDGSYLLQNYAPIYNSTYSIKVKVEGEVYEASDSLVSVVPIDSLTQIYQEQSTFLPEGYMVFVNFTDPSGKNFYRIIRNVNGEYIKKIGEQIILDDSFTEGNKQTIPLYPKFYQVDDTIQVELISYSEKTFNYYTELYDAAGGSEMSAAPANPTVTWTNDCLGHFAVYGYDTEVIIVEEDE